MEEVITWSSRLIILLVLWYLLITQRAQKLEQVGHQIPRAALVKRTARLQWVSINLEPLIIQIMETQIKRALQEIELRTCTRSKELSHMLQIKMKQR